MGEKGKADVKSETAKASLRQRPLLFMLPVAAVALMMGAAMFFYSRSEGSGITIPSSSSDGSSVSASASAPKAAAPTVKVRSSKTEAAPAAVTYSFPADINKAHEEQILACPRLNKKAAESLLRYREKVGTIHDLSELLDISGIGEKTLAVIAESFFVSEEDFVPKTTTAAQTAPLPVTTKRTATTRKTTKATTAPAPEEPEPAETTETTVTTAAPERRPVNINLASAEEIAEALLITPEQADKIVEMREKIHGYRSPNELCLIDGFSTKFVLEIRDYALVDMPEEGS